MSYPLTAIVSDLHANVQAVTRALRDAAKRGAERVVCLGDVIGYGAKPHECIDAIRQACDESAPAWPEAMLPDELTQELPGGRELKPGLCLLGNHEQALISGPEDFNPKARAAIEWTKDALNSEPDRDKRYALWDWLDELEPMRCDEVAMFAHGSPRGPVREYLLPRDIRDTEKMAANFASMERYVCFVGHSHVPAVYYEDGRIFRPKGTDGPYDLGATAGNRAIVNVGSVG
ncbi:MAG: metallophosphoesterase family protein, partial [Planctomycetota bacterium]